MTSHEIVTPPGNPGVLRLARDTLGTVATDLDSHGGILRGEQAGLLGAWPDENGQAASAETGAVSSKAKEYSGHLNAGKSAISVYADALETAQRNIGSLYEQAVEAEQTVAGQVARRRNVSDDPSATTESINAYPVDDLAELLAPIMASYRREVETLDTAKRTCRQALLGATPGFQPGRDCNDMRYAIRNLLASELTAAAEKNKQDIKHAQDVADQVGDLIDKHQPIPPELLTEMEKGATNPFFAVPFLQRLGPARIYAAHDLMVTLGREERGDFDYNTRVLGSLGKMIATGTNDESAVHLLSDDWVNEFLAPLDGRDQRAVDAAWTLSDLDVAAGNVEYRRGYLGLVGDKLYNLEHDLATDEYAAGKYLSGHHQPIVNGEPIVAWDPSRWYFEELGEEPLAAQDFLADKERTDFYLTGRGDLDFNPADFDDSGKAFGSALEAATLKIRTGPDADRSADIATNAIAALGSNSEADFLSRGDRTALRTSVGNLLVGYAPDINASFDPYQRLAGPGPGSAIFDQEALVNTMRLAFTDGTIEDRLIPALAEDQQARMTEAVLREPNYKEALDEYRHLQATSGSVFGAVYSAHQGVLAADASDIDSRNKWLDKGLDFVLGRTIGGVPGDLYGFFGGDILFPDDHEIKVTGEALSGRVDVSQEYADLPLSEAAAHRLQELHDRDQGPGSDTVAADLQQNNYTEVQVQNWGAVQWRDDQITDLPSMAPIADQDTDGDGFVDGDADHNGVLDEVDEIRRERTDH